VGGEWRTTAIDRS